MSRWMILALAAAWLGTAAEAQEVTPEEAVRMRQGVMRAMSWQFAPIGAVVKGERPFDTDLARRAANLAALAKVVPEGFAHASGPDTVPATKAKPAVWTDGRAFGELMRRLNTEAERLALAAQSRDGKELREQFAVTARLCKDCHDQFRTE